MIPSLRVTSSCNSSTGSGLSNHNMITRLLHFTFHVNMMITISMMWFAVIVHVSSALWSAAIAIWDFLVEPEFDVCVFGGTKAGILIIPKLHVVIIHRSFFFAGTKVLLRLLVGFWVVEAAVAEPSKKASNGWYDNYNGQHNENRPKWAIWMVGRRRLSSHVVWVNKSRLLLLRLQGGHGDDGFWFATWRLGLG